MKLVTCCNLNMLGQGQERQLAECLGQYLLQAPEYKELLQ
jgi:hypothetical protein